MGRRLALALAASLIVVLLGAIVARRLFEAPAPVAAAGPATPAPTAALAVKQEVKVVAVSGIVQRGHAGAPAVPLKRGDVLTADDVVQTSDEGSASLKVGGVAE